MSACASIQTSPGGAAARARQAGERPIGDRVVAAEHDRQAAAAHRILDHRRKLVADLADDVEILCRGIFARRPTRESAPADCRDRRSSDPEPAELLVQLCVAHRRRTHVDAAAARAQIHRHADDIDAPHRR